MESVDVLCVGQACYDLVFGISRHPDPDEKCAATRFIGCGGGPAANAAVTVSRLGCRAAFAGYLGEDIYGCFHLNELTAEKVRTAGVYRGTSATPLSAILVKPNGARTVVNYRDPAVMPPENAAALLTYYRPKVILFDGHQPHLSSIFMDDAVRRRIPTVLDAGSVHAGTRALVNVVDYVVASEKFARDFTGQAEVLRAVQQISGYARGVVVTRGEAGLAWQTADGCGTMDAFVVETVDTTGAGDAFHGAFAAGIAQRMEWHALLRFASAVGALTCTRYGARPAIPDKAQVDLFLKQSARYWHGPRIRKVAHK